MSERIAVFGYGSLVSRASVAVTLGRDFEPELIPATLTGWRRRWSLYRDNSTAEKSFAPLEGEQFQNCLGLNVERDPGSDEPPNGALIELTDAELDRLDVREIRYDRADVTSDVDAGGFDRVVTYVAKAGHLALEPPPRSVIIATYLAAVEAAFEELGPGELEAFRRTTGPPPVPVVEARLVRDEIPPGNPRTW